MCKNTRLLLLRVGVMTGSEGCFAGHQQGGDCSPGGLQWVWQKHHHTAATEVLRPRGRGGNCG